MTSPTLPHPSERASASLSAADRGRRIVTFLLIAGAVILVDQWTKALVRARLEIGETWPPGWELIRLTHLENTGAAFGIFPGASGVLMIIGLGAVAAIAVVLVMLPSRSPLYTIALSGILGGAVGNLIDRVRLGGVTDFIDPTHYPAFNIADSAIVLSVIVLLAYTWFQPEEPRDAPRSEVGR